MLNANFKLRHYRALRHLDGGIHALSSCECQHISACQCAFSVPIRPAQTEDGPVSGRSLNTLIEGRIDHPASANRRDSDFPSEVCMARHH